MSAPSQKQITQMLMDWGNGDQAALEKLTPLVYGELHRLARRYMGRERPGHTLQTSALVNEAYIRLIDWKNIQWQNRAHFFAVSAQLMRRILGRELASAAANQVKVWLTSEPHAAGDAKTDRVRDLMRGRNSPEPPALDVALAGWFRDGEGRESYEITLDRSRRHSGSASASIKPAKPSQTGFAGIGQAIAATAYRGKRVRLSAYIKARESVGMQVCGCASMDWAMRSISIICRTDLSWVRPIGSGMKLRWTSRKTVPNWLSGSFCRVKANYGRTILR